MSARLALDLDHDAIRLLSQQSDGWVVEGVAGLDAPDLTAGLAGLRQRAEDLGGPDPSVLLVLPRSQVLYTRFEGLSDPEGEVPALLDGLTPYALTDITWDHVTVDGETRVAAVALETIDEALAFAASCRFDVVGLTSEPPEGEFPRLPVFQRLPAFLRVASPPRPLVLEPARPPARKAVAFSSQRGARYTPGSVAPPLAASAAAAAARTRDAARRVPGGVAALLARIPKPIAGAIAVGGAVILGAALWPERDPDAFARGAVDLAFTELPAAAVAGLAAPDVAAPPARIASLDPVTVLRDPPFITVPVILGTSGVAVDYVADITPAEAFESVATAPALFGETRLPAVAGTRPVVVALPAFPSFDAPTGGAVARVAAPGPIATPAAEDDAVQPRIVAVAATEVSRAPSRLGSLPTVPAPPAGLTSSADDPSPDAAAPLQPRAPDAGADEEAALLLALAAPSPAPDTGQRDVAALPPAADIAPDLPDAALALPPPGPDDEFDLGPDGFVAATPEGTPTPGGVLAIAGAPARVAPPRPVTDEPAEVAADTAPAEPATLEEPPVALALANPNPELASVLPRPRPGSGQADLDTAPDVPDAVIAEALEGEPEPSATAPVQEPVMTASLVPRPRPARAAAAPPSASVDTATATRAAPSSPRIPSRANVAREATFENALPLGKMNLIGVYGSANNRRALVRLPTGRFVKLKVGDRIDGGQVAQIGPDRLLYQKGTRTLALDMPNT